MTFKKRGMWLVAVVGAIFLSAASGYAQTTQPSSITISPQDPTVDATLTQQFTAQSGQTLQLRGGASIARGTGASHSCTLMRNGTIHCWGSNAGGDLGDGSYANSSVPVAVKGLKTKAVAITVGDSYTCAVLSDGTADCWGSNLWGELGDGSTTAFDGTALYPQAVTGLTGVKQIAAGHTHTCALLSGGTVDCWGENSYGDLGNGSTAGYSAIPVAVSGLTHAVAIATGDAFSCAMLSDGTVDCWGANGSGQLGDNSTTDSNVPVVVSGLRGAVAIATGDHHACAVLSDGTADCWGDNLGGDLGNKSTTSSSTPVAVSGLSGAVAIAAGQSDSCALLSGGTVDCWGGNTFGELGNNSNTDSSVPVTVVAGSGSTTALGGAVAISSGFSFNCALLSDGGATCWGDNEFGQLGNNSTTNSPIPVTVTDANLLPGRGVAQVAAGDSHACTVLDPGTVKCWGDNYNGELGNNNGGNGNYTATPVYVVAEGGGTGHLTDAVTVTAGMSHTCALISDGTVDCWGDDSSAQLGIGHFNINIFGYPYPQKVVGENDTGILSGVKQIAAGGNFTCALLDNGKVDCWGDDSYGQLGPYQFGQDALTGAFYSGSPVPVADQELSPSGFAVYTPLTGVKAIAASEHHACALLANGTVECWGADASTTSASTFAPVKNLTDATAVTLGSDYSCALRADGTVVCWGYDDIGQLGNGSVTTQIYSTPVQAIDLSGVKAISAWDRHTCAVLSDGTAKCWGANYTGQLGDGHAAMNDAPYTPQAASPTPVAVEYLSGAMGIAAGGMYQSGDAFTCSLLGAGKVECWGDDSMGELGNGSIIPGPVVTPLATRPLAPSLAWASSDASVATIDAASGLATAVATGSATITGTYNGLSASTTLTVQPPPKITSAASTTFTVNQAGTFTVTATGNPTPTITEIGALPSGVTFSATAGSGTGTLSGTPAAGTGGAYNLTFTARNGTGVAATQSFTLTVDEGPAITSTVTSATFTVGTAGSVTFTTTGTPTPTLAETGAMPSGVTFTDNQDGTATLAGTPAAKSGGVYNLTITASNNVGSDATQSFTLTVDQPAAITSADSTTFTVQKQGSFTFTTSGYPTVTTMGLTGSLPQGVTGTYNGDGTATISGSPYPATEGTYPLTITASNGIGSTAKQSFTLTVLGTQTIKFTQAAPSTAAYNSSFTVAASSSSGLTVSLADNTTSVCTMGTPSTTSGVTSATVKMISGTGTCTIEATQSGNADYAAAAPATTSAAAAKATAAITFGTAPTPTYLGGNFTVSATTTNTDSSTLTFSVSSGPCALVSGSTFSSSGAGTCVVQASGAPTTNFTSASNTQNVSIGKAPATITISNIPADGHVGGNYTPTYSYTGDGTPSVSSSTTGVCTVSGGTLATFVGAGTCTLTAHATAGANYLAADGKPQSFNVLPVQSISVTPANPTLAEGDTQQFTATGSYSDHSTLNLTDLATWTSSKTKSVTIDSTTGLATAVKPGTSTITATFGAIAGSTVVSITGPTTPTLQSIAITPTNPTIDVGGTVQFTATGTYSDGSVKAITSSVTWSSTNTSVATIDKSGVATGAASGTSTITATLGGVSESTTLTVQASLVSIAITPVNPTMIAGTSQQFTATGTYTNGSTQDITDQVTWTSSKDRVATVSSTGVVTAVSSGRANIKAALGGINAITQVDVPR